MRNFYRLCFSLAGLLLFSAAVMAQNGSVSGVILDETDQPLPGATVKIEGTTLGSTTDLDGKYKIENVPPGDYNLVVSFIGYEPKSMPVKVVAGQNVQAGNFSMKENTELLEEVVIVGYGVQRKREVTGSIAKIDAKRMTELPVPSFEAAMQGQAAGLQVNQGSGAAGSASIVRIRGIASISAGGDPLYVVDGIPITQNNFLNNSGGDRGGLNNNPLAFLNPNDIESVEVLKDAASTGIYGARGANGVILITTKRANKEGLQFDFNARVGLATPVATPNMLNSDQYLQLYQEAWENDGNTGLAPLPGGISWEDARRTNTDWVDETTGLGVKHGYNFSVRKGTKKFKAFANLGYEDNDSYLLGNSYERISGRVNLDYQLTEKITIGLSSSLNRGQNNRVDAAWSGGYGAALSTALPIYPTRYLDDVFTVDENGNSVLQHAEGDWWTGGPNPVRDRELKSWRTVEYRSINNLYMTYAPVKNIIIRAEGRYEHMDIQDDIFIPEELDPNQNIGLAKKYPTWANNYNYTVTANWLKTFNEKHDINFLVGNEYQRSKTQSYSKWEVDSLDAPLYEYDGEFNELEKTRRPTEEFAFISYFGRVNYMFKRKYIVQGTFRVDGSSRFGSNNRYGYFPSASAGWVISEESFLKDSKVVSFLKAKVSGGITGNAGLPNYEWWGTYDPPANQNDYNGLPSIYPTRLENPDLKWETATTLDGGIEFGFLNDRITGEITAYTKTTRDVILQLTVPRNLGFETYFDNVGEILNRGIEFSIKSLNTVGKFKWTTEFNIANNYNEIVSIGDYSEDAVSGGTNATRVVVGSPVGTSFLVRFSHVDPANGRPVYLDINGKETYEWNPNDRVP
ncbi:MAG: SusC/RagA family TonB-linked outer membrane protein [Salibacteraceae bacterium]